MFTQQDVLCRFPGRAGSVQFLPERIAALWKGRDALTGDEVVALPLPRWEKLELLLLLYAVHPEEIAAVVVVAERELKNAEERLYKAKIQVTFWLEQCDLWLYCYAPNVQKLADARSEERTAEAFVWKWKVIRNDLTRAQNLLRDTTWKHRVDLSQLVSV